LRFLADQLALPPTRSERRRRADERYKLFISFITELLLSRTDRSTTPQGRSAAPAPTDSQPGPSRPARATRTPAETPLKTAGRVSTKAAAGPPARPATAVPAAKPPAKAGKSSRTGKPARAPKVRQKPVRDSFTMPEADFALIATLKARLLTAGRETKKSELLRAGLHALDALDTKKLVEALGQLEPVKVGRPKKGH
jgi:hypothetical protein